MQTGCKASWHLAGGSIMVCRSLLCSQAPVWGGRKGDGLSGENATGTAVGVVFSLRTFTWFVNRTPTWGEGGRMDVWGELEGATRVQLLALHRHPNNPTLCIPESSVQVLLELWQPWGCNHCLFLCSATLWMVVSLGMSCSEMPVGMPEGGQRKWRGSTQLSA